MGGSSEHRSTREPKAVVCTLGTLKIDCWKAFSLLRFFVAVGQRNEVPPRTVANSDKKFSQHLTRANVRSSNPAPTPTTAGSTPLKEPPSANGNTLANSDKKYHQHSTRANVSSNNPAPTQSCGRRNGVPPRTVANSDKKFSQNTTRATVSSSNPAPTPTTAGSTPPKEPPSANENTLANSAKK